MRKKSLVKMLTCGAVAAGLIAALGLTACGGSPASSSASSNVELQVFAANSLSKAMDEAQELYTQQTGVTFADTQYKASGELNEMLAAGLLCRPRDHRIQGRHGYRGREGLRGRVNPHRHVH